MANVCAAIGPHSRDTPHIVPLGPSAPRHLDPRDRAALGASPHRSPGGLGSLGPAAPTSWTPGHRCRAGRRSPVSSSLQRSSPGDPAMTLRRTFLSLLCLAALAACGGDSQDSAAPSAAAPASSAVSTNGRLKVCGTHICNASGAQVQLKGMSWFWSNTGWGAERFFNATAVQSVVGWGATVVRAPIGVEGDGGYLSSSSNASAIIGRVTTVVDAAIAAGIYVIVDWHYSSSAVYQSQANTVFQQLAQKYASSPNVIWEPFNEPTSNSWSSLKTYHEAIIKTIRAAGSQNLVVVGTPTWSQDVDVASQNKVVDSANNVAYTLHFYAGTHTQWLRDKANTAMNTYGVAIFVTEWGTCDASGNGNYNAGESTNWT